MNTVMRSQHCADERCLSKALGGQWGASTVCRWCFIVMGNCFNSSVRDVEIAASHSESSLIDFLYSHWFCILLCPSHIRMSVTFVWGGECEVWHCKTQCPWWSSEGYNTNLAGISLCVWSSSTQMLDLESLLWYFVELNWFIVYFR